MKKTDNIRVLFKSIPTGDSIAAYHILNALEAEVPEPDEAAEAFEWLEKVAPWLQGSCYLEAQRELERLRGFDGDKW